MVNYRAVIFSVSRYKALNSFFKPGPQQVYTMKQKRIPTTVARVIWRKETTVLKGKICHDLWLYSI
jgi:hypothetical protein